MSVAKSLDPVPEAFVSDKSVTRAVSRAVKAGKLRKLASRLYSRNMVDPPEAIVARNLWSIVAGYFPGALIADRTALENVPASDGSVCLIAARGRDVRLPGHTLRPRRGVAPLPADPPFLGELFLCSTARAFLENMRPSRARRGLVARTLGRAEIEERLDALIRRSGEDAVNRLRDETRALGSALGLDKEAATLDALIGALLGTREAALSAPSAVARGQGRPHDPDRLALFQVLHAALRNHPPLSRIAPHRGPDGSATLAFFEAYFSNFIEGTEFAVDEAADIVFRGAVPNERPADAHDVLGTWRIVSDDGEMGRTPTGARALEALLTARHASVMEGRPDTRPGAFKQAANQAGLTVFVAPDLVPGTLAQGFHAGSPRACAVPAAVAGGRVRRRCGSRARRPAQLTIGSRGMWFTRSHSPLVTMAVSPMHMLCPVVSSSRTMCRKNTIRGSSTCGLPAHTIGQSIQVGGYIAPMV